MSGTYLLDLQHLQKQNEKLLYALFDLIAKFKGRELTQEEIITLFHNEVIIRITGTVLSDLKEANYALFLSSVGEKSLTIKCVCTRGGHEEIMIPRGRKDILIYAGIARSGKFSSNSSNWEKNLKSEMDLKLGLLFNIFIKEDSELN